MQESENLNIWEEALKEKNNQNKIESQEKTLIVLGDSRSGTCPSDFIGKSTVIKILKTDANVDIKPTILFQYSFIKKPSSKKQIIHCYELSNKSQKQIIPSLLTKDNYARTTVVVCVDLARPTNLIEGIKEWLQIIRDQVDICCSEKLGMAEKRDEYLAGVSSGLVGNQDVGSINPMPLEVVIVGCKYDEYEKEDSENRKWLSKTLRYFAHVNHCSLFYSSSLSSSVISQVRTVFNELLFSSKRPAYSQKDHLKPIYISRGHDSIQSLSITHSVSINPVDVLKKQINALFSVSEEEKRQAIGIDISKYQQNRIERTLQQRKDQMAKISKGNRFSDRAAHRF